MAQLVNGSNLAKENKFEPNLKYSEADESCLIDWIGSLTGSAPAERGQQGFHDWLKDGQVLAKLMGSISPGSYTANTPSKSRLPAKRAMLERENINYFIQAVGDYGIPSRDLFQIPYLYEQENMYQVQLTLILLKALYEKKSGRR